jgi:hypothetical protein
MMPSLSTAALSTTRYAPLLVLGWWVSHHDLFSPIRSRVQFLTPTHTAEPVEALLDLLVGLLAGCEVVAQVNTTIRSDPLLAHAWGRTQFAEQSTIARTLDAATSIQVAQWRAANEATLRWIGQVGQHAFAHAMLLLDLDLTGLVASARAQGSQKGYFAGKKTLPDDNWPVSQPHSRAKSCSRCFLRAPRPLPPRSYLC